MSMTDYYKDHQTELLTLDGVKSILKDHGISGLLDDSTGTSFYNEFLQFICLPNPLVRAEVVFTWLGY